MFSMTSNAPTLGASAFDGVNTTTRNLAYAIIGSLLLWASAKVQIPFFPVPMTMQTFVVLFVGFALGSRLGAATVLLYLAQGAMGLPVFAGTPEKGIGLAYMMGPTGGFLLGFVAAAFVAGWLAERGMDRRVATTLLAALAALAVNYAFGLAWLGSLIGWDQPVLQYGLYPFAFAEVFKLGLAAAVLPLCWRALRK